MPEPAHIVLITTGQPASNPRLVKEAQALSAAGYRVTVLYSYWAAWAQRLDRDILEQAAWTGRQLGGDPGQARIRYAWTRLRRKVAAGFPRHPAALKRIFCRAYDELVSAAVREKADLYIAHNLGALPVAAEAARRNQSRYAFDAEDYHRGEQSAESLFAQQVIRLEDQYMPDAIYLSSASPLIGQAYQSHYPINRIIIINNVFSKNIQPPYQAQPLMSGAPLKLFWFSQTTGLNRGLQEIIQAMNMLENRHVQLTLIGQTSPEVQQALVRLLRRREEATIRFLPPVEKALLIEEASQHHIGLALEPAFSVNNDIALSNKLFSYLLAGNAVIASETHAQRKFMEQYPQVGRSYPIGDVRALAEILKYYWEHPESLEAARRNAWQLAHDELNWETEQQKLLTLVRSVL